MAPNNSLAHQFLMDLLSAILADNPLELNQKSVQKDIAVMRLRCSHEGIQFITKTLPVLGRALDNALEEGLFKIPREFKRAHGYPSIPAFGQEYFKRAFDSEGVLLDQADPLAIQHLRQICYAGYKYQLNFSQEQASKSISKFRSVQTEQDFLPTSETAWHLAIASDLVERVFHDFNSRDFVPGHGPGAVAGGEQLDEKWVFTTHYNELHQLFPYYDYFVVSKRSEIADRRHWYKSLCRREHGVSRFIQVPKDSRGPRNIAAEPLEYMWLELGLSRKLVSHIESHRDTRGRVNFTDQSINGRLALESSQTREWATLDLRDASDRVSTALVREVFSRTPDLGQRLLALRTPATLLPNGEVLPLRTHATMGNALCFPTMSIILWALAVAAISTHENMRSPWHAVGLVYVYGDDVIVKSVHRDAVTKVFQSVGLAVNEAKSFSKGFFRESCGVDAFKGVNVTPIRAKKLWTGRQTDASPYVSYIALANEFAERKYVNAVRVLVEYLSRTYGPILWIPGSEMAFRGGSAEALLEGREVPPGSLGVPAITIPKQLVSNRIRGLKHWLCRSFRKRWSEHYQRVEIRALVVKTKTVKSELDGWPRLLRGVSTSFLERDPSVLSVRRRIKLASRWRPI